MAEGYKTYRIAKETGSVDEAMRWGVGTEESYYGLLVSGVKSYADLSANYAGMRFWESIVDGKDPYFACHEGLWARVREFTWKDYVTDAWDEGINCSQFTRSMGATVLNNLKRKGMTCPVADKVDVCRELTYMTDAKWFVSPACWRLATSTIMTKTFDPAILVLGGRKGD
jgi:hypothetical protein